MRQFAGDCGAMGSSRFAARMGGGLILGEAQGEGRMPRHFLSFGKACWIG